MRVLVIGAGKMVEAILLGLGGEDLSSWEITSKSGASARDLAARVGATYVPPENDPGKPDWILLGVKPQQIRDVTLPDVPVMSLLAAIPEQDQKKILGVKHLVRVMPNLPVKFRRGVSLLTSSSQGHLDFPQEIFRKVGKVKVLSEKEFTELTLLTGSGPALFYEFTKSLAASFSSLSDAEREELAVETLAGAAASVGEVELQNLIDAVTSKGGVTIAVLEEWRRQNLGQVLRKGIEGGLKRSGEIRSHLLQS